MHTARYFLDFFYTKIMQSKGLFFYMELLKECFLQYQMWKCLQSARFLFQNSPKDRMTHFNISYAEKRLRDKRKVDFPVKCEKYSKSRNYTVKNFHMVKFCQIEEIYRKFENLP